MTESEHSASARALWMTSKGHAAFRAEGLRPPKSDEAMVEALVSGISRGTEALVFAGAVPESEWQRMRCPFQDGDFPFPVKYGYAMVGRRADDGSRVFCLHPHQSRFVVPVSALIPVQDAVSTERAALAPQMETALNATWDAGIRIGDRVAVVGAGTIGCLVAYLAGQIAGTRVTLIDIDPARASVARALGVDFALAETALPDDHDLVFHASASAAGLDRAIELAGFEATIIELSWFGTKAAPIRLGGAFHSRRLSLRASQVGHVAPERRMRRSLGERLGLALGLCADPRLDVMVGAETPFDEMPERLGAILAAPTTLCHLIRYRE